MPDLLRRIADRPKAIVAVTATTLLLAGGMAFVALRPTPAPSPPVTKAPEWRCADQAKGGSICVRPLPPAAKAPA